MPKQARKELFATVKGFFDSKNYVESVDNNFEGLKKEFYSKMDKVFDEFAEKGENKLEISGESKTLLANSSYTVTKVERPSVTFDAEKLEEVLGKEKSKAVIKKEYRIKDYSGLCSYLKSCNVNPAYFKKFLEVERTIDRKELERLYNIGEVSLSEIKSKGAYKIEKGNSTYYKVVQNG